MTRVQALKRFSVAAIAILFFSGSSAWAADAAPASSPPSKEQREKMAQAHEKMAACLRSDRVVMECRQEMMQTCQSMMGDQGCGMGMMGGGMMRNRATKSAPAGSPASP
jgi:hypothetical protein